MKEVEITSNPDSSKGQENRSSKNFVTRGLEGKQILWSCPSGVSFQVWKDQSGKDPIMLSGQRITNGIITSMIHEEKLYISKPQGASSDFTVTAIGVATNGISVTSDSNPSPGQENRSSTNFSTNSLMGTYILWNCPFEVSFEVWKDETGKDPIMLDKQRVSNGNITPMIYEEKLYISKPKGASGAFTVSAIGVTTNDVATLAKKFPIQITSSPRPLEGESSRSSGNFRLNPVEYVLIRCPKNIKFRIKEDVSGGAADPYQTSVISDGQIIEISKFRNKNIYICDPEGASSSFLISFEATESPLSI